MSNDRVLDLNKVLKTIGGGCILLIIIGFIIFETAPMKVDVEVNIDKQSNVMEAKAADEDKVVNKFWFSMKSGREEAIDFGRAHLPILEEWKDYLDVGSPTFSIIRRGNSELVINWNEVEYVYGYTLEKQHAKILLDP